MRRILPFLVLSLVCSGAVLAQQTPLLNWVPPGTNPETGARPGSGDRMAAMQRLEQATAQAGIR